MIPIEALLGAAERHLCAHGRPLVTLSYAQSLDGSIAARRGSPLPLSGPESLVMTHTLRAAHHVVLVGIGTVLADDPRLNVRLARGRDPQPVVLDSRLRLPLGCRLVGNVSRPPWVFTTPRADRRKQQDLEAAGVRVLRLAPSANGWVDLKALLAALAADGVNSVMVEGGARVITSFLRKRLVDRLVVTVTPTILGGLRAVERPMFSHANGSTGNGGLPRLRDTGYELMGADLVMWGSLAEAAD